MTARRTPAKSQIQDLLRTTDFYVTVPAIACHDLRQPLQAIVGAHELLARRVTAGSERQHLERSEQGSAQLRKSWTSWSMRSSSNSVPVGSSWNRFGSNTFCSVLRYSSTGRRSAEGSILRLVPTRAVIMSQPVLLDGILPNLARNALDHTPSGVRVLARMQATGGDHFVSRFTTLARPFRADKLNGIFERFYPPRRDALRGSRTWAVHRQAGSSLARTSHRALFGSGPRFVL